MFKIILIVMGSLLCIGFPPMILIALPVFLIWSGRTGTRIHTAQRQRAAFLEHQTMQMRRQAVRGLK